MGLNSDVLLGRISFKESPFYTVLQQLTSTVECKGESPSVLLHFFRISSNTAKYANKLETV
jgi:hypothetical protein